MCRVRCGVPRTPLKATIANLDCSLILNAMVLFFFQKLGEPGPPFPDVIVVLPVGGALGGGGGSVTGTPPVNNTAVDGRYGN